MSVTKVMMVSVKVRRSGYRFHWLVMDKLGATLAHGFEPLQRLARAKAQEVKAQIVKDRPEFIHNLAKWSRRQTVDASKRHG